jgi:hypothetical protein
MNPKQHTRGGLRSHRFPNWQRVSSGVLLSGLVMSSSMMSAQPSMSGRVKDFSWPEFYDPPHQNQMKSLLTGAEAQPQADGKFLIKELKLETYREDGEREIIVAAPECVYDSAQRVANSAGRLQVQTGDGRFTIEGEGFLWQQTNASLVISNRVHTTIRPTSRKTEPSKS